MALVDKGKVGTVILKGMSRLGRDYLKVGMYTGIVFPNADVRFIAVSNGVDSAKQAENDMTPIISIFNEFYAKDTSRKNNCGATRPNGRYSKIPTRQLSTGRRSTSYSASASCGTESGILQFPVTENRHSRIQRLCRYFPLNKIPQIKSLSKTAFLGELFVVITIIL